MATGGSAPSGVVPFFETKKTTNAAIFPHRRLVPAACSCIVKLYLVVTEIPVLHADVAYTDIIIRRTVNIHIFFLGPDSHRIFKAHPAHT